MARVRENIVKYVDTSKLLFVVAKSFNDNVILYEYDDSSSNIIKTSWLSIDPKDKAKHEARGNTTLRADLNMMESMLFGCKVNVVDGGRFLVTMNQEQLSDRVFEIVLDGSGRPTVIGTVEGHHARVDYAYVQMRKGTVPEVDYLLLYGTSTEGRPLVERISGA
jgi:hypothetical protein